MAGSIFSDDFQTAIPNNDVMKQLLALSSMQEATDYTPIATGLKSIGKVFTDAEDAMLKDNTATARRAIQSINPQQMVKLLDKGIDPVQTLFNAGLAFNPDDAGLMSAYEKHREQSINDVTNQWVAKLDSIPHNEWVEFIQGKKPDLFKQYGMTPWTHLPLSLRQAVASKLDNVKKAEYFKQLLSSGNVYDTIKQYPEFTEVMPNQEILNLLKTAGENRNIKITSTGGVPPVDKTGTVTITSEGQKAGLDAGIRTFAENRVKAAVEGTDTEAEIDWDDRNLSREDIKKILGDNYAEGGINAASTEEVIDKIQELIQQNKMNEHYDAVLDTTPYDRISENRMINPNKTDSGIFYKKDDKGNPVLLSDDDIIDADFLPRYASRFPGLRNQQKVLQAVARDFAKLKSESYGNFVGRINTGEVNRDMLENAKKEVLDLIENTPGRDYEQKTFLKEVYTQMYDGWIKQAEAETEKREQKRAISLNEQAERMKIYSNNQLGKWKASINNRKNIEVSDYYKELSPACIEIFAKVIGDTQIKEIFRKSNDEDKKLIIEVLWNNVLQKDDTTLKTYIDKGKLTDLESYLEDNKYRINQAVNLIKDIRTYRDLQRSDLQKSIQQDAKQREEEAKKTPDKSER